MQLRNNRLRITACSELSKVKEREIENKKRIQPWLEQISEALNYLVNCDRDAANKAQLLRKRVAQVDESTSSRDPKRCCTKLDGEN